MAGGFSVSIGSDTRLFEQGIKTGVIAPVENAQDALQDLGRAGERAGDGLSDATSDAQRDLSRLGREARDAGNDVERGMRNASRSTDDLGEAARDAGNDVERGMRDASRSTDDLGDAARESGRDLERSLRDAQQETNRTAADYRDLAEEVRAATARMNAANRDSMHEAGGVTGEFRDEAISNFSEVTSSFTGDMQSITDLAQGTFGGLASLGGPASLAFGGIAVAVGLIGSALAESGEESEEFKEKIQDLANTKLGDLFSQYEDSGNDLARSLRKWATDADSFGGSLVDLRKNTKNGGVEFGRYADAIATQSIPKMKEMRREVEAHIKSLDKQASEQRAAGNGSSALATKFGEQADAARAVKKQLDDNLSVNDEYEKSLRAVAKAQGMSVEQYKKTLDAQKESEEAAEAAKEAEAERVDEQKAKLQEWADTVASVYAAAAESESEAIDNSAQNADEYAAGLEKRTAAAQQFQQNIQAIGKALPDDLFNFVRDQGPGFSEEIATYLSATPEQRSRIENGWRIDAQIEADTKELDKITDAKSREKKDGPTSKLKADPSAVDKKVAEKGKEKKDGTTLKLRVDTDAVDKAIERYRNKKYNATVVFKADTSNVTAALNRLDGRHISVIVDQKVGKKVA